EALAHTKAPSERDQVLGDIGGMFALLGINTAARDAYLILAATAQSKLVRWSATLNLMELSGLEGDEEAFDGYARELAREPLNAWVRSHYLLFLGEGFARFGRSEAAEDARREASTFDEANEVQQIAVTAQ